MAAADLPNLIADARLILEYAIRAGVLPDDSLAEAIQRLEASDSAQNIIDLQNAMNAVVARIRPMNLVDLRAGRNPFDIRNVRARVRWQVGLSCATLLLIFAIASYQHLMQRQEAAVREYRDVIEARGSERITEVRKLVQQGKALAKDSCARDSYQRARHDLRRLAERTFIVKVTLYELSKESPWPFVDPARDAARWLVKWVSKAKDASEMHPSPPGSTSDGRGSKDQDSHEVKDPCDESQRPMIVPVGYSDWLRNVVLDSIDEFCFASKLEVDQLVASDPIRRGTASTYGPEGTKYEPIAIVEGRMRTQVGWGFPVLYGLLGACVYVMRRLLFDTTSAVVENVVIVLRLALGALAGVAIGWVSAPSASTSVIAVSSLPYLLAFLAGFSIDMLFILLDRFNAMLIDKKPSA